MEQPISDRKYIRLCDQWEAIMHDQIPYNRRRLRNAKTNEHRELVRDTIDRLQKQADEIQQEIRRQSDLYVRWINE